ncbi:MAG: ATP-binding protein [Candidatus Acidiferrum sp.]
MAQRSVMPAVEGAVDFFRQLFMSGGFQPHGDCYQWNSGLVWLNVISDALIALAYFSIPLTLLWIIRKRRDLPFSWMFTLFGLFIIACGTTHVMEVWNLWHRQYWLAGVAKAITAAASISTAALSVRLIPQAIRIPSPNQWIQAKTELARESEERKQGDEKFRLLVMGVKDYAILMLDPGGRITTWNEGAEHIKGYRADEIIGEHFSKFYTPEAVAQGKPSMELKIAADEGRFEEEGWRVRKDGSVFWASVVITALRDATGQLRGYGKVTRDITHKREAEAEVERQQKELARSNARLIAVNNELESFSYSVSHDLRAPLRTIDGFSHALLEDCGDRLDETNKTHLNRIRAATQRMGMLIDDLLNLSRLSRTEMHTQSVDISAMAFSVAGDLQKSQPERDIELRIEDGLKTTADPGLLRAVLENLLSNAWKFTSKGASAHIEFGATHEDGTMAYFVRDDGAGFDPAYADRLFGAFQRLHSMSEFAGTGVGLATVQRIVHRHGGRIWAKSEVNHGATFYFTLSGAAS